MESSATQRAGAEQQLLVFGYACKLFRDDEKALYIDGGRHLIPWMGDDSLRIDRYDGRGALHDLRQHELFTGGPDHWHSLTDRERKLEQLVDQERYLALYQDEDEQRMLEEEEWKRVQSMSADGSGYQQTSFNYDTPAVTDGEPVEDAAVETPAEPPQQEEPYTPPDSLNMPAQMITPETRRHADIIERTADFVARKGPQMEILIKAKQSDNEMFNFLSFNDPLQPFFRHLVIMIKSGRFVPGQTTDTTERSADGSQTQLSLNFNRSDIAPSRVGEMYQPVGNCAYQLLVKNIRSQQAQEGSPADSGSSTPVPQTAATPTAAAAAPTAAAVRPNGDSASRQSSPRTHARHSRPRRRQHPQSDESTDSDSDRSSQTDSSSTTSRSSSDSSRSSHSSSSSRSPSLSAGSGHRKRAVASVPTESTVADSTRSPAVECVSGRPSLNGADASPATANSPASVSPPASNTAVSEVVAETSTTAAVSLPVSTSPVSVAAVNSTAAIGESAESVAQKPSQTRSFQRARMTEVVMPPPESRLIIDKMASYVAKNGRDFETIVLGRGDERFSFLRELHEHNGYYRQKLLQYEMDLGTAPQATPAVAVKLAPVSFSIRGKCEETAPLERSALPMEESDDDEDGDQGSTTSRTSKLPETAVAGSRTKQAADRASGQSVRHTPAAVGVAAGASVVKAAGRKQLPVVAPAPGLGCDQLRRERKRRAAQFMAKLRDDVDHIRPGTVGTQLPRGSVSPEQPPPPLIGPVYDREAATSDLPSSPAAPTPPSHPATHPLPPSAAVEAAAAPSPDQQSEDETAVDDLDKYKLVDTSNEESPPASVPEVLSEAESLSATAAVLTEDPATSGPAAVVFSPSLHGDGGLVGVDECVDPGDERRSSKRKKRRHHRHRGEQKERRDGRKRRRWTESPERRAPLEEPRRTERSPGTGTRRPRRGDNSPEGGTHRPRRGDHSPETVTHRPRRGDHSPETVTHKPRRVDHSPEGGTHRPRRGDHSPEGGTHRPRRGDHSPETGTHRPRRGDHSPETVTHKPRRGDHSPEGGTLRPRRGDHSPETVTHRPRRGDHSPEGGTHRPRRGDHSPETSTHRPRQKKMHHRRRRHRGVSVNPSPPSSYRRSETQELVVKEQRVSVEHRHSSKRKHSVNRSPSGSKSRHRKTKKSKKAKKCKHKKRRRISVTSSDVGSDAALELQIPQSDLDAPVPHATPPIDQQYDVIDLTSPSRDRLQSDNRRSRSGSVFSVHSTSPNQDNDESSGSSSDSDRQPVVDDLGVASSAPLECCVPHPLPPAPRPPLLSKPLAKTLSSSALVAKMSQNLKAKVHSLMSSAPLPRK